MFEHDKDTLLSISRHIYPPLFVVQRKLADSVLKDYANRSSHFHSAHWARQTGKDVVMANVALTIAIASASEMRFATMSEAKQVVLIAETEKQSRITLNSIKNGLEKGGINTPHNVVGREVSLLNAYGEEVLTIKCIPQGYDMFDSLFEKEVIFVGLNQAEDLNSGKLLPYLESFLDEEMLDNRFFYSRLFLAGGFIESSRDLRNQLEKTYFGQINNLNGVQMSYENSNYHDHMHKLIFTYCISEAELKHGYGITKEDWVY